MGPQNISKKSDPQKVLSYKNSNFGDILKKDDLIAKWLSTRKDCNPEVFVILADALQQTDREAILQIADDVLSLQDDLISKLAELYQENRKLSSLNLTDALTGLYNYGFFSRQIEIELKRTRRTGLPFSLMMIDVDNFKLLNDTLGHEEGNSFLVNAANMFSQELRPTDIACRYGGDEFSVLMPATHHIDAMLVAKRLRTALTKITQGYDLPVSFSVGIAEYAAYNVKGSRELIEIADKSLYKAKKNGKNQIWFEERHEKAPQADAVGRDEKEALLK